MVRYERYFYEPELITAVLDECDIANVGLMDKENAYVVPLNFGYKATEDKLYIYMHSGKTGYKLRLIENNPRVCLSFWTWQNFPDKPYKGKVHDFASVMAFGKIRVASLETEPEVCKEALKSIFVKTGRSGCKNPKGIRAIDMIVVECDWEDVSGKAEHPVRKPEDVKLPDVHNLPEDDTPWDYGDLCDTKEDKIRNRRYLGYLKEGE